MTLSDGEHDNFGNSIQEKFPTNLKCHLKTKLYEQFKELQKKESNKKEKGGRAKRKSSLPHDTTNLIGQDKISVEHKL